MGTSQGERAVRYRSKATMARYMDAAEALYIKYGYEGTSIRAISNRAKMNLSTVVYHWGTKEKLFRSVFLRRFADIEAKKVQTLRSLRDRNPPPGPADLEAILAAMVDPGFTFVDDPKVAFLTRQLYGRVLTDPSAVVIKISEDIFREVTDLWRDLIRLCVPEMSDERFFWRYTSTVGAVIFAQSFGFRIAHANRISENKVDWQAAPGEIVRFMAGGLRSEL